MTKLKQEMDLEFLQKTEFKKFFNSEVYWCSLVPSKLNFLDSFLTHFISEISPSNHMHSEQLRWHVTDYEEGES